MILNQRQYRVTKAQINRLKKILLKSKEKKEEMDLRAFKAMIAGIESQIMELSDQVKEYEIGLNK